MTQYVEQTDLATKEVEALIRHAWSNEINYFAVQADPMVPAVGSGIIGAIDAGKKNDDGNVESIPGKVLQNIEISSETKVARSVTLQKTLPLAGAGYQGLADPGDEEMIRFRYCKVYANDLGHASSYKNWGITSRETLPTGLQQNLQKLLAAWRGEKEGADMRYALIWGKSPNLEAAPHSLTASFNPHAILLTDGTLDAIQPVYHQTAATYSTAVMNACLNVAATVAATQPTIPKLVYLASTLEARYIKPFMYDGRELWALYMHPTDVDYLNNFTVAGSYGAYIKDIAAFGKGDLASVIPHAAFIVSERLVIVRDKRTPLLGITDNTTFETAYMKQGRTDERPSVTGTTVMACNLLMGEDALIRFNPEPWSFHRDEQNHAKDKFISYDTALSFQRSEYDDDNAASSADNMLSEGSAVVLTKHLAA